MCIILGWGEEINDDKVVWLIKWLVILYFEELGLVEVLMEGFRIWLGVLFNVGVFCVIIFFMDRISFFVVL